MTKGPAMRGLFACVRGSRAGQAEAVLPAVTAAAADPS